MTKWFDSNYHYLVPEFDAATTFTLQSARLLAQVEQALSLGHAVKPVLLGPLTFLWLGKSKEAGVDRLSLLDRLLPVYVQLLAATQTAGHHLGADRRTHPRPRLAGRVGPGLRAQLPRAGHGATVGAAGDLFFSAAGQSEHGLQAAGGGPARRCRARRRRTGFRAGLAAVPQGAVGRHHRRPQYLAHRSRCRLVAAGAAAGTPPRHPVAGAVVLAAARAGQPGRRYARWTPSCAAGWPAPTKN